MQCVFFETYLYKGFEFGGIAKFTWDVTSPYSVIIGTNGAGKSSLLRECNPRPAVSTDYGPNGYKKAIYLHNGSEYIVHSDFSKKTKPHSFKKDGEELNESGSTTVQEELVATHLGYTPAVHAIMTSSHKFCEMSAGARKALLMSIDPADIGFLLDWHKLIASQLRAFKNNLAMLHDRKASLEGEMLDPKLKESLVQENTLLTDELSKVIEHTYKIEAYMQQINRSDPTPVHPEVIKRETQQILKDAGQYQGIPRGSADVYAQQLQADIATVEAKLVSAERTLCQVNADIDRYETHLAQSENSSDVQSEIATRIQDLEAEIALLQNDSTQLPFDSLLLDTVEHQITQLSHLTRYLLGADPEAIRSPVYASRLRHHYQTYSQKSKAYHRYVQDLTSQIENLEKDLLQKQDLQIPGNCPRKGCALLERYTQVVSTTRDKYDALQDERDAVLRKRVRCDRYLDVAAKRLQLLDQYTPHVLKIAEYLSDHGYLRIPLRDVDLITILKVNPTGIVVKIQEHLQRSRNYHRVAAARSELEVLQTKYNTVSAPSESNRLFLSDAILEKMVQKQALLDEHARLEAELSYLRKQQLLVAEYSETIGRLHAYAQQVHASAKAYVEQHEWEVHRMLHSALTSHKAEITTRLAEIHSALRQQDLLESRYTQEVMANIATIQERCTHYDLLEKVFSPTTGIPHQYAITFNNRIIAVMNEIIAQVISYPMELKLLDPEQPIDYRYRITVGDVPVPDISMLSTAQKKMVDLAFCIALIVIREHNQYPIQLDEPDKDFDHHHKQQLLGLFKSIVEEGLVSQLFLISHHTLMSSGFHDADYVVLNGDNILVPEVYNTNVVIER